MRTAVEAGLRAAEQTARMVAGRREASVSPILEGGAPQPGPERLPREPERLPQLSWRRQGGQFR